MTAPGEWRAPIADIAPGTTAKFRLECGGKTVHGFVVHHPGGYAAYVNQCPHVGTPLDLWPNDFLSEDRTTLICSTHGALFEPESGRCTAGPCAGDALSPLPVRCEGDAIVVVCPSP